MTPRTALDAVLTALRCPVCRTHCCDPARVIGSRLPSGHRFDIARQGYVALLGGRSAGLSSDTADMISARRAALSTPKPRAARAVAHAVASEWVSVPSRWSWMRGGTGQYWHRCSISADARGLGWTCRSTPRSARPGAIRVRPRSSPICGSRGLWPMRAQTPSRRLRTPRL